MAELEDRYNPEQFPAEFNRLLNRYTDVKHKGGMLFGESGKPLREEAEVLYSQMVELTANSLLKTGGGEDASRIRMKHALQGHQHQGFFRGLEIQAF